MGESGCVRRCCFVAEPSMKPRFFELFLRFYITFCAFPLKCERPLLINRCVFERPTLRSCH